MKDFKTNKLGGFTVIFNEELKMNNTFLSTL